MEKLKISVVGVGYVGLCTAVGFASRGFDVIAADNDLSKLEKLKTGITTFFEPRLPELLKEALASAKLSFIDDIERAISKTSLTFIAVGTPSKIDGSIDLQYVNSVAHEIGRALRNKHQRHIVVVKSTVVPGTTQNMIQSILEEESQMACGEGFWLCMNPEFLRQGCAFYDTFNPDRVIIGQYDKASGDTLQELYEEFYSGNVPPIIRTTLSTAELIKYTSNSLLATKISFINTIANISEKIPGADVKVVAKAVGLDKRIGPLFLDAGLGYGGSCFPKDVKALIAVSKQFNFKPDLLESVESINQTQPLRAVEKCKEQLGGLEGKNIAILGLAFKPNTDDMREARVIPIINQLLSEGAKIKAYDPVAFPQAKALFADKIEYSVSATACLKNADCAILVTEWDEFKTLRPDDFIQNMKNPIIVDGRRLYSPELFKQRMTYIGIGLGT